MKRILTIMAAALLLTGAMTAQVKMNNVLDQMKKELAPDSRTAIWDVRMVGQGGHRGRPALARHQGLQEPSGGA